MPCNRVYKLIEGKEVDSGKDLLLVLINDIRLAIVEQMISIFCGKMTRLSNFAFSLSLSFLQPQIIQSGQTLVSLSGQLIVNNQNCFQNDNTDILRRSPSCQLAMLILITLRNIILFILNSHEQCRL